MRLCLSLTSKEKISYAIKIPTSVVDDVVLVPKGGLSGSFGLRWFCSEGLWWLKLEFDDEGGWRLNSAKKCMTAKVLMGKMNSPLLSLF
ncbi:unnamed protein product [Dovyalis caffra]|uniref:Uncharacterized protein n=1 Tax=Dovyalis caffra TaxID=77055 RepID=A0AAV1RMS6_9ROSI|nr:unnamed protein product [Dovyalis caffra]